MKAKSLLTFGAAVALSAYFSAPALAVLPQGSISASVSGTTVNITITPTSADTTQSGSFYLAASAANNKIYFYDGASWQLVDLGKSFPPSFATGPFQAKTVSADTASLGTVDIFGGYGKDFNDLVTNEKYGYGIQVKSQGNSTPAPVVNSSITATSTKTGTVYTVNLTILSADQGKTGVYYVAALDGKDVYMNDGTNWKKWDGKTAFPSFTSGTLNNKTLSFDSAGVSSTQFFVGYGQSQDDMINKGKFIPLQ